MTDIPIISKWGKINKKVIEIMKEKYKSEFKTHKFKTHKLELRKK